MIAFLWRGSRKGPLELVILHWILVCSFSNDHCDMEWRQSHESMKLCRFLSACGKLLRLGAEEELPLLPTTVENRGRGVAISESKHCQMDYKPPRA